MWRLLAAPFLLRAPQAGFLGCTDGLPACAGARARQLQERIVERRGGLAAVFAYGVSVWPRAGLVAARLELVCRVAGLFAPELRGASLLHPTHYTPFRTGTVVNSRVSAG